MSKQDVEDVPQQIPKKRRQLEAAPDVWLAVWLSRNDITPSERRRVQAVKDSRKAAIPDKPVGLLVGPEGLTPNQLESLKDALKSATPTEIHHPGVASTVHSLCRSLNVPVIVHRNDMKEVVKSTQFVIGTPKESREPNQKVGTGVWEMIRYAKHRSLVVKIITPDGAVR